MDRWAGFSFGMFMLLAVASVFGWACRQGWRTGIAVLPLSLFAIEEFERGESVHFWPIVIINGLMSAAAAIGAGFLLSGRLSETWLPLSSLQALNGCYRGPTAFESISPPRGPTTFRVKDGVMFDRTGERISTIRVGQSNSRVTPITFSPGVSIGTDRVKNSMLEPGATGSGRAYVSGDHTYIAFDDDWGHEMHISPCR